MRRVIDKLLRPRGRPSHSPAHVSKEPKYVEVDWKSDKADTNYSVVVLTLNEFADVERVLDNLRDRNKIILLKIKARLVQEKMELKRALKRIQRTSQAIKGDIAGVKDDVILITPPGINIGRSGEAAAALAATPYEPAPLPIEATAETEPAPPTLA